MTRPASFALLLLFALAAPGSSAQDRRPIPYPVIPGPRFDRAVEAGTRTTTGHPGPNYWTNTAEYVIEATLTPETSIVRGTGTVTYHNLSPSPLNLVVVHLRQNLHAEGVVRNRPQRLTGGVTLGEVTVGGEPLAEVPGLRSPGYRVDGTVMTIRPPEPVEPGESVQLTFEWNYRVPEAGAPRNGTDGEVWYMAYWYPQIAVFDDVNGWKADPYMGDGEFYMGYADYDVRLTVPEGFLVAATGTLQNPDEVLSDQTAGRLEAARNNPEAIIRVVDEEDREAGVSTAASDSGLLTWHFRAERVRDFAWGTSSRFLWDATVAEVGDRDGDGAPDRADIFAFWRPEAETWLRSAEFGKFSIEFLSRTFFPYPYPHMTAVEGPMGGGMEYPMMTLIGRPGGDRGLFGVTLHEIAHMYFPMIVGQDEKEDTWMDEGLTSFNTAEGSAEYWGDDPWIGERQGYFSIAGTGQEVESRRHADRYPLRTSARGIAAYSKPAVALHALRGLLGNDLFYRAYREYATRWSWRHPQPEDLFNTFEDVVGRDLDWFWTTMFYTTWTLDQGVASVTEGEDGVRILVEDHGLSPFPAPVRVTYADGTTAETWIAVEPWLLGERSQTLRAPAGSVTRVEIDPEQFLPDVNRSNNLWKAAQ
jgi:hypothetical protein